MFKIQVQNIELQGYKGIYGEESEIPQKYIVTVGLHIDETPFTTSRALRDTINYEVVAKKVVEVFKEDFEILEDYLVRLSDSLKTEFPNLKESNLSIQKRPPFDVKYTGVEVVIEKIY